MVTRRSLLTTALAPAFVPAHALGSASYRVGVALPLTGVQSDVATDMAAGYRLAFDAAAERGFNISLELVDDRSEAGRTAAAITQFGQDKSFVATTGIVGTPNAIAALPMAIKNDLPVVGIRSGAQMLRTGDPLVFHLRSSFEEEITGMLDMLAGANCKRLAVVYSDDAFGQGALVHLKDKASKKKVTVVSQVAADRSGSNIEASVQKAVAPNLKADALILLVLAKPMLVGLRTARNNASFVSPTFAMSFTATRLIGSQVIPYAAGLGMFSAFDLPRTSPSALAQEFRALIKKVGHPETLVESLTAYEAFCYGSTLVEGLARSGSTSREKLVQALMARPLPLGGLNVQFNDKRVSGRRLVMLYKDRRNGYLRT